LIEHALDISDPFHATSHTFGSERARIRKVCIYPPKQKRQDDGRETVDKKAAWSLMAARKVSGKVSQAQLAVVEAAKADQKLTPLVKGNGQQSALERSLGPPALVGLS
jgi:hypothetical protein